MSVINNSSAMEKFFANQLVNSIRIMKRITSDKDKSKIPIVITFDPIELPLGMPESEAYYINARKVVMQTIEKVISELNENEIYDTSYIRNKIKEEVENIYKNN